MKITSVIIKNYRAIEFLKIDFKKNIQFLYGVNGTGKSSIIYAINDLLMIINGKNNGIAVQNLPLIFSRIRIRDIRKISYILIRFDNGTKVYAARLPYNITKIKQNKRIFTLIDGTIINYGNVNELIQIYSFIPGMGVSKLDSQRAADGTSYFRIEDSPLFARSRGIINFEYFKRNIIVLMNKENKKRLDQIKKGEIETFDPVLNLLRESINQFDSSFSDLSYTVVNDSELLTIKKNGVELNFEDQLSSGEAYIITFLGIVCFLLANNNKSYPIICIDEIDASLHPTWQVKICKILKDVFPYVQFIATSHSPFIWYGSDKENILWLKINDKNNVYIDNNIPFAKGAYIDNLVASCFGIDIYDQDVAKEIHSIEDCISHRDFKQSLAMIENMRKKYGDIQILDDLESEIRFVYDYDN